MSMARGKGHVKFGFLFWVGFILLVLLLAFVNKDNIKAVLEQTNAKGLFKKKETPEAEVSPEIKIQEEIDRIFEQSDSTQGDGSASEMPDAGVAGKTTSNKPKASTENGNAGNKKKPAGTTDKPKDETEPKKTESSEKPKPTSVSVKVYFVKIDSDGKISRVASNRSLPKSNSPMSDALKALFNGTVDSESTSGYKSLIPTGTKLLGAKVENGVAYVNVSEAFEFNQYGIEGYLAQLSQVVYTATEYSTVNSVQFLIQGQKKDFLGAEGVWIGSPLSRSSF